LASPGRARAQIAGRAGDSSAGRGDALAGPGADVSRGALLVRAV
jgi:hypothetical protein